MGIRGKSHFFTFRSEKSFLAFNGPINIAGGRLDILFHFPNDWDKNIEWKIEKIIFDFFDLPLDIFVPIVRKVEKDV